MFIHFRSRQRDMLNFNVFLYFSKFITISFLFFLFITENEPKIMVTNFQKSLSNDLPNNAIFQSKMTNKFECFFECSIRMECLFLNYSITKNCYLFSTECKGCFRKVSNSSCSNNGNFNGLKCICDQGYYGDVCQFGKISLFHTFDFPLNKKRTSYNLYSSLRLFFLSLISFYSHRCLSKCILS